MGQSWRFCDASAGAARFEMCMNHPEVFTAFESQQHCTVFNYILLLIIIVIIAITIVIEIACQSSLVPIGRILHVSVQTSCVTSTCAVDVLTRPACWQARCSPKTLFRPPHPTPHYHHPPSPPGGELHSPSHWHPAAGLTCALF